MAPKTRLVPAEVGSQPPGLHNQFGRCRNRSKWAHHRPRHWRIDSYLQSHHCSHRLVQRLGFEPPGNRRCPYQMHSMLAHHIHHRSPTGSYLVRSPWQFGSVPALMQMADWHLQNCSPHSGNHYPTLLLACCSPWYRCRIHNRWARRKHHHGHIGTNRDLARSGWRMTETAKMHWRLAVKLPAQPLHNLPYPCRRRSTLITSHSPSLVYGQTGGSA